MSCLVTKDKSSFVEYYEHYYTLRCNNVTENNKMNETENNERQKN